MNAIFSGNYILSSEKKNSKMRARARAYDFTLFCDTGAWIFSKLLRE